MNHPISQRVRTMGLSKADSWPKTFTDGDASRRIAAGVVFCLAMAIAAPAQTFKVLLDFNGSNGGYPYQMSLIQGRDGNLYGTTNVGGSNQFGTIFKVTTAGSLTTLFSFYAGVGINPFTGLILATDGNFYGTTEAGGASGYGTVFKITPSGTLTTLHSFNNRDGAYPISPLIQATDGNFYGTTWYGGNSGQGTIFKISATGTFSTLYSFCALSSCADGALGTAGLVQADDGNFYGTTAQGGNVACNPPSGCGTVFRVTSRGALTTLHVFCAIARCADGESPSALFQANDGSFYGTTNEGGSLACDSPYGCGTVFKINSQGTLTTLHSFGFSDGAVPFAPAVQGTDGNLYGTTSQGGLEGCMLGCGTLFTITTSGKLSTLHLFDDIQGGNPYGSVLQATNGVFYGTTEYGGEVNYGIAFSLDVGLGPFVTFVSRFGRTGTAAQILGNGLSTATAVTFNGVPAQSFKVLSDTFMKAVVPPGAISGPVQVTTPTRQLTSNENLIVEP